VFGFSRIVVICGVQRLTLSCVSVKAEKIYFLAVKFFIEPACVMCDIDINQFLFGVSVHACVQIWLVGAVTSYWVNT